MPEAKDLDVVLEDFVVNDDRSFDQFSDIRAPRMFMSGLRTSSYHIDAFTKASQEGFGSR
jgi:hypothetical protein